MTIEELLYRVVYTCTPDNEIQITISQKPKEATRTESKSMQDGGRLRLGVYKDRQLSRIIAKAINKSGVVISDDMAKKAGLKNSGTLRNKLNRNSFSLEQIAALLEYCEAELVVNYADCSSEKITFDSKKED